MMSIHLCVWSRRSSQSSKERCAISSITEVDRKNSTNNVFYTFTLSYTVQLQIVIYIYWYHVIQCEKIKGLIMLYIELQSRYLPEFCKRNLSNLINVNELIHRYSAEASSFDCIANLFQACLAHKQIVQACITYTQTMPLYASASYVSD